MRHRVLALGLVSLFAACGAPEASPPDAFVPAVDPTGNWAITYSFSPACGMGATTSDGTFTVTLGGMGYQILVAGVSSAGSIICDSEKCKLSGTWAWQTTDTAYQQSMNLTLGADSSVTGTGTEQVLTSDSDCTYPFTATGQRM